MTSRFEQFSASISCIYRCIQKIERVENVKSVTEYINRIDEMLARKETFLQKHKEELLAE